MSDAVGKVVLGRRLACMNEPVDCRSRELVLDKAPGLCPLWLVIRGRRHDKKKSSERDEMHTCYEAEQSFFCA